MASLYLSVPVGPDRARLKDGAVEGKRIGIGLPPFETVEVEKDLNGRGGDCVGVSMWESTVFVWGVV